MLTEELFKIICKYAHDKNETALNELINDGINIHDHVGDFSPLCWLAKEGDKEAILFLLTKFNGDIHEAVLGACWGNHALLFLDLLNLNFIDLQNEASNDIFFTMYNGFFRGVDSPTLVEDILNNANNQTLNALQRFSKNLDAVDNCFSKNKLLVGFHSAAEEKLLSPLTYRELASVIPKDSLNNKDNYQNTHKKLTSIFAVLPQKNNSNKHFPLTITQAALWILPELHLWFLTGFKKFKNALNYDLFLRITSYIFDAAITDLHVLFIKHLHTVPQLVCKTAVKHAEKTYDEDLSVLDKAKILFNSNFPGLFSSSSEMKKAQTTLQNEIQQAQARYLKRITW